MTFMFSEFLKFLLLECCKLLEPNGCVRMRMDLTFTTVLAVPNDHKYQHSTTDTLMLASVLYEHVQACFSKPNMTVKHKSMICHGPQTSSP